MINNKLIYCVISAFLLASSFAYSNEEAASQEEFSDADFAKTETAKDIFQMGGLLELRPLIAFPQKNTSLYKLRFFNNANIKDMNMVDPYQEYNAKIQLDSSLEYKFMKLYLKLNGDYQYNYTGNDLSGSIYEGYFAMQPSEWFKFEIGRLVFKWGKGYAWNPVSYIDRPKDPTEPDLSLQGFYAARMDFIKSFDSPLKTISFTPVFLPVFNDMNTDFGSPGQVNFAGRLYMLLFDTDIDINVFAGQSKETKLGLDFSREIIPSLELHGEYSIAFKYRRPYVDSDGNLQASPTFPSSFLLGLRFITTFEMTIILEYYRNEAGYTVQNMTDFYSFVNSAYDSYVQTTDPSNLQRAAGMLNTMYGRFSPMQDYIYFKISQKDPFNWLYFTPSLTFIWNVDDLSFMLTPELLYTGITNIEMRLRGIFLIGWPNSEFGEKFNNYKIELRLRYMF